MENYEVIDTLNVLLETSRDGENGFTACAEDAKDPTLRAYFAICATRCRESVHTLEEVVKNQGGIAEQSGSAMGSLNRAWLNLRAAMSSNSDLAVLEECERAEDTALKAYKAALEKELPADVRPVVQVQCNGVQENHDRVRGMRDAKRLLAA
ncbi:MAG: PA2169 family four-helix-bundle protein [Usitatibacteraceae bacterium]